MNAVRDARLRLGLSQRKLAERAGLSFRGIQLLEAEDHDARLSSLGKVAGALDLPSEAIATLLGGFFRQEANSFRSASMRMIDDEFKTWPLHLFNAVDALRRTPKRELIAAPPIMGLNSRLEALIAATVESLCCELALEAPPWCNGVVSLSQPWFVSGIENLKASALIESPAQFRQRNIFVLANFLERA